MSTLSPSQLAISLAQFSSLTRLYALHIDGAERDPALADILVEAFVASDAVNALCRRDLVVLSPRAKLKPAQFLGQRASLEISLADRSRSAFHGSITEVEMLGSDGGFTRYRFCLSPWLWRLGQVANSRVWEEKSVIEIVDAVFNAYQPDAVWCWTGEARRFMAHAMVRSYCCQYRESDLDFVRRLLAEEGLNWRYAHSAQGPELVIFADSRDRRSVPEDPACSSTPIRYHSASAVEAQDSVQAITIARHLTPSLTTLLSHNYKTKQAVAASSPSHIRKPAGLPELEDFDVPGQYAFANSEQARRYADLRMEAHEASAYAWTGRSTLRSLCAGTRMRLSGLPRQKGPDIDDLSIVSVISIGVNNLPSTVRLTINAMFGGLDELLDELLPASDDEQARLSLAQARLSGYSNRFEAIPSDIPWRPQALLECANPTAHGSQSAIVIGADGRDRPDCADELYCDRLGRIRIRFHWQDNTASCWVRVAQRAARRGMGTQFLPRIGQEVLVQFLENDIDRPIVVGALYNGQGEGGRAPTPGGQTAAATTPGLFELAHDHLRSAQGNLAGGQSPVWHGASPSSSGHNNHAAQWGVRSKEFGGNGYNQLLFDDTDAQGRIQLRCSHAASELNLGHLIHAADNYRGSLRGLGAELRTDAYGALRAGAGLLVSSYAIKHDARERSPAGENAAAVSLVQQAVELATTMHTAALTHHSVGLASVQGSVKQGASVVDPKAAPLAALQASMAGVMAGSSLPHMGTPIIAIAASADFAASAGQSMQLANGDSVGLISGADTECVSGAQMRVHSRQAIGVLGGTIAPGPDGVGVQLIAASEQIDIQAQSDAITLQARDDVTLVSVNAHIDWAAAKRISLSTAGGANITIEGGNITIQCPGKIKVHAGKKSFVAPVALNYPLPKLPRSELEQRPLQFKLRLADTPGPHGHPLAHTPWKIAVGAPPDGLDCIDDEALIAQGDTDADGNIVLTPADEEKLATTYAQYPDHTWLVYPGQVVRLDVRTASPDWTEREKLFHALDAADFSADLHASSFEDGASPVTRYATDAFDVGAAPGIFDKFSS